MPIFLNFNYFIFIPVLVILAFSIREKKNVPYFWWNVIAPLNRSEPVYDQNVLKGLRLNQQQIEIIESVDSIVAKYSKSDNDILTFPHIPIFYLLNNKRIPSHAVVHWFDFLPDNLAIEEAKVLKEKDFHVIIELDFGEEVWRAHEMLFRAGMASGQRRIQEVINAKKINNKMNTREIYVSSNTKLLISFY